MSVRMRAAPPSCRGAEKIRKRLPARLPAIDDWMIGLRGWMRERMSAPEAFTAELIAREALINAVAYGCGEDEGSELECVLRYRPGRLTVAVADPGAGFDWRREWSKQETPEWAERGRGLELIRTLATRTRYNDRGNRVVMILKLEQTGPKGVTK